MHCILGVTFLVRLQQTRAAAMSGRTCNSKWELCLGIQLHGVAVMQHTLCNTSPQGIVAQMLHSVYFWRPYPNNSSCPDYTCSREHQLAQNHTACTPYAKLCAIYDQHAWPMQVMSGIRTTADSEEQQTQRNSRLRGAAVLPESTNWHMHRIASATEQQCHFCGLVGTLQRTPHIWSQ